jgi:hypothetical protein
MPVYTYTTLDDPLADNETTASGINAAGQIVGWYHGSTVGGDYNISHDKEMHILAVCLRRVRAAHALVRAMYRRASAAERARQELASMPRYKVLTPPEGRRTPF